MTNTGPAAPNGLLAARVFSSRTAGAGCGRRGVRPVASRGQGTVGLRLALAFIAVAVLAVALVAVLAVVFTNRDVAALVDQRHSVLARALAADAVSTYSTARPG